MNYRKNKKVRKTGMVYLVGAGPGDPGLITVRGKKLLESCDSVVYDHLVHLSLVSAALQAKEKIYVGKKGLSGQQTKQSLIEQLLIRLAQSGKTVVRLKGGDPFVFGRGGEEMLALRKNGIPVEVVPGVTAGFGVPAYAGIPVTHRGLASEVTFVTAHEDPKKTDSLLNWGALAQLKGTLVIYMGMHMLEKVAERLIHFGKSKSTPAAMIEWGTLGNQKTVLATLGTIGRRAKHASLQAPVITAIGEVVNLRKVLNWYEKKPLFGRTVIVTRSQTQASVLREKLEDLGARVIEFPTIEIQRVKDLTELDDAIRDLKDYDFIVFTSENGIPPFVERLEALHLDARSLYGIQIVAVGPGTEAKLKEFSLKADLIPHDFSTKRLFEALMRKDWIHGRKFLLLRTHLAPKYFREQLEKNGGRVTEVSVYETHKPKGRKELLRRLLRHETIDYVTFTSSSTAENFFELLSGSRNQLKTRLISIGPVTSATIRRFGRRVYREANPHTIDGLVQALLIRS